MSWERELGLALGRAGGKGRRAGPAWRETGRAWEEREGVGLGLVCWVLGWVPSYFFLLSISIFPISILAQTNLFEFKQKFEVNHPMHTSK